MNNRQFGIVCVGDFFCIRDQGIDNRRISLVLSRGYG